MKTNIYFTALLAFVIHMVTHGQALSPANTPAQEQFNSSYWNAYADKLHLSPAEKKEFIDSHKKQFSQAPVNTGNNIPQAALPPPNPQNILAGPCVNIDFESGTINGWTPSRGYHPTYNPLGCCPNAGGQQTIMTGNGVDPAGGFPVVAPGGNFSLRLGNSGTGGEADRIQQTFLVSPGNANFTYRYAVVFQDPGHTQNEQPSFQIDMIDSTGAQIPCTFYNVVAGQNVPGFFNSPLAGVVYKPWTNVLVDLTNYIGQNVTIRFTAYDCALGGHYGYAYIDGSCQAFVAGTSDVICQGNTKVFCAPGGLGAYSWSGPGIVNNGNTQCATVSAAGVYTCQTTLVTGCTGPEFTYTLSYYPDPVVSFNNTSAGACAQQYTFTNTSSIVNGSISSFNWNFGGNNLSPLQNPVHTFPSYGTYPVTLTATSDQGCSASATQTIAIYPYPAPSFAAPATCQNSIVNFTNTSTIPNGSIVSSSWNFGNGATSNLPNPSATYTTSGNFVATLSVTSNQNCVASTTANVTIHPKPNVSFASNNVCHGATTNFTNNSSIASGSIINYIWDFDNDNIPNSVFINPSTVFQTPGNYTISLQVASNFNCVGSATSIASVMANPTASFSASNACHGKSISFSNLSSMGTGGQIINYGWNFGNGAFTGSSNPVYTYPAPGTYTVQLSVLANNGCNNTFTSSTTVHHTPNVSFGANVACHNQVTQFTNASNIGQGNIVKWRWDFENDGIWDDTLTVSPARVYANTGNFNCRLQALSNFQCESSKTNQVIVRANPVANFINQPACLGNVSTFTNTSFSSDGPISSYQWDFNGDNVTDNVSQSPTYTYAANGTYLLKLEVQTIYGCTNVKSKSMYVNPTPNAVFAVPSRSGCPNFCVTFTNSSTIATGKIANAFWQYGDGSATEANMGNPSHCYNAGNYDVNLTLVSDSGCRATITKPAFITVYPQPVAGFRVEPEEVDENDPVIDVVSDARGADQTTYFINDKQATYHAENFHHVFKTMDSKPMIYQVVKNQYGCTDTTSRVLDVKPSFAVYVPNTFTPNGDGVNDGWFAKGVGITKFAMAVYDRWGHILFQTTDINQSWDGRTKGSDGPIKQDVYVWKATVTDVFNRRHDLSGTVSLIP